MSKLIILISAILLLLGLDFCITSGLFWVVCWAFGLTFTWKIALGIWVISIFLAAIFKSGRKN